MDAASERVGTCAGRLSYFSVVSSTNDVALRLAAAGADDGTTVLAATQTAGRGRHGRQWFSPSAAGLYFSVVMRGLQSAPVTLMAGVAVAEGIRAATGVPVELKWPNDVVLPISGRQDGSVGYAKLAGILAETSRTDGIADAVVVGIGINIERAEYPPALAPRVSSLRVESDVPVDRAGVLVESLAALSYWRQVLAAGAVRRVLARWRELAPTSSGATVAWSAPGGRQQGVTEGIDDDGALRVRSGSRVQRLVAGDVTWLL